MKRPLVSLTRAECRHELEAALARMLSVHERERPFVILEHIPTKAFVQFRGSQSLPLLLDVPGLRTVTGHFQHEYGDRSPETLASAAATAFHLLSDLAGSPLTPGMLLVQEHPEPLAVDAN